MANRKRRSDSEEVQGVKLRGKRKKITPEQLAILEPAFEANDTPNFHMREQLASRTGMTNREVQVWAQNRRAKRSRTHQTLSGAEEGGPSSSAGPSTAVTSPEMVSEQSSSTQTSGVVDVKPRFAEKLEPTGLILPALDAPFEWKPPPSPDLDEGKEERRRDSVSGIRLRSAPVISPRNQPNSAQVTSYFPSPSGPTDSRPTLPVPRTDHLNLQLLSPKYEFPPVLPPPPVPVANMRTTMETSQSERQSLFPSDASWTSSGSPRGDERRGHLSRSSSHRRSG